MFEFVWESEIFRHFLECFAEERGEFVPDSGDVVERVEKVDDERSCRFLALYLLLPKVESSCTDKFV